MGESGVLRRAFPLLAAFFLIVLEVGACRPAVEAGSRPAIAESATSDVSLFDSAAPRDIVLGKLFAPDGSIQLPDRTNKFSPGAPIFLSVDVGDLPGGTPVVAIWTAPDGTVTDQRTSTIGGEPYVAYTAPSSDWPVGSGRVSVRIEKTPKESSTMDLQFEITH